MNIFIPVFVVVSLVIVIIVLIRENVRLKNSVWEIDLNFKMAKACPWTRNPEISFGRVGPVAFPPCPARKEFETMLAILRDAERYNLSGRFDISSMSLESLIKYINGFLEQGGKGTPPAGKWAIPDTH